MKTKVHPPAVLVTGGARRIGRAIALAFADSGWDVALHFNTSGKDAESTAQEIRGKGRQCVSFQACLDEPGEAGCLVERAGKFFPGLQAMVHSASLFRPSGLEEKDLFFLDEHMGIHVRAAWMLDAAFVRGVGKGAIVHFLDTKITTNKTEYAAYLLSKKALAELVKMSAVSFAPAIRVNAVAPGFILPPEGKGAGYLRSRAADVPLQRKGKLLNITDTVKFLVDNDYITGQVIFVDGGEHLM
ncbi:MAG: SDR family oxidoreductase [Candidatus Omnitrophica bacterium]|nr:SDR family oxidoreductase [Candidatus Omnitrophota bacterium]